MPIKFLLTCAHVAPALKVILFAELSPPVSALPRTVHVADGEGRQRRLCRLEVLDAANGEHPVISNSKAF